MTNVTMHAPISATAVADWFIERALQLEEQDLSNLKLQKLIYLAHSLYLHRHHMTLISEDVPAWENGPAVKPVYGLYKGFGPDPIKKPALNIPRRQWPEDIEHTMLDIWTCFAGYSAWKLREITHVAGPWKKHWQQGSRDVVIPVDEIAAAWEEFEAFAETAIVARADTTAAALARYAGLLSQLPETRREGDLDLLRREAEEHSDLTRRASSLLA